MQKVNDCASTGKHELDELRGLVEIFLVGNVVFVVVGGMIERENCGKVDFWSVKRDEKEREDLVHVDEQ